MAVYVGPQMLFDGYRSYPMPEQAATETNKPIALDDNWMRVAPGTDAAIWRPWNRETGEL